MSGKLERLVARNASISRRRPGQPRELRISESGDRLTWKPPAGDAPFTHYRVRIDRDAGPPDFEISAGQVSLQIPRGATYWLSAYNSVNGLESPKAYMRAGAGGPGAQYAPNVLSLGGTTERRVIDGGLQEWRYNASWVEPVADARFNNIAAYLVYFESPDGKRERVSELPKGTTAFVSGWRAVPGSAETYKVWLVSKSAFGQENPIVPGATPKVEFTVEYQAGTSGREYAPVITPGSPTFIEQTGFEGADGTKWVRLVAYGTCPTSDPSFGGVRVYIDRGAGPIRTQMAGRILPIEGWFQMPASAESWTVWVVSLDTSNRDNAIVDGVTPKQILSVGSASGQLNLKKGYNWSADFSTAGPTVVISSGAISTPKLSTSAIDIGGGGGKCPKLRMVDSLGSLFMWCGDNTDDADPANRYVGFWAKQGRLGGASPSTAPVRADASGNVTFNGATLALNLNGVTTEITNVLDTDYAGLRVKLNSSQARAVVSYKRLLVWNSAGSCVAQFGLDALDTSGAAWVNSYFNADLGYKVVGTKVVGAQQAAISDPAGGSTIDTQARAAISSMLAAMRTHGLIAT